MEEGLVEEGGGWKEVGRGWRVERDGGGWLGGRKIKIMVEGEGGRR